MYLYIVEFDVVFCVMVFNSVDRTFLKFVVDVAALIGIFIWNEFK